MIAISGIAGAGLSSERACTNTSLTGLPDDRGDLPPPHAFADGGLAEEELAGHAAIIRAGGLTSCNGRHMRSEMATAPITAADFRARLPAVGHCGDPTPRGKGPAPERTMPSLVSYPQPPRQNADVIKNRLIDPACHDCSSCAVIHRANHKYEWPWRRSLDRTQPLYPGSAIPARRCSRQPYR